MTSYSNYSLEGIELQFAIKNQRERLFNNIIPLPITEWLENSLKIAEELPIRSEKARSELIVVPILIELRNQNDKFFTIYSGDSLNVDEKKGLRGECDFIIAKDTGSFNINVPILQVVEAKKLDIDAGIPQCAAQMIGASIFNKKKGVELEKIYGCVTTGDDWQFLKFEESTIFIDTRKYYLGNIEELLGVMQYIINYYKDILG